MSAADPRLLSPLDRLLIGVQSALASSIGPAPAASTPSPARGQAAAELREHERQHAAGLMRINHTGEVCAQALYLGQALLARTPETRRHLLEAAAEEADHLAWCEERLSELDARPSVLNPLWYAGSFAIGAAASVGGDALSFGFVDETERQVEAHLEEHLQTLPAADAPSRAILEKMQADEARHGAAARAAGGRALPAPIPRLMAIASGVMKAIAYRY